MAVCTYDNPKTFSRECWQDKKLVCFYCFELFFLPNAPGCNQPIPPEHLFFGANIGPIVPGQKHGDPEAIGDDA